MLGLLEFYVKMFLGMYIQGPQPHYLILYDNTAFKKKLVGITKANELV